MRDQPWRVHLLVWKNIVLTFLAVLALSAAVTPGTAYAQFLADCLRLQRANPDALHRPCVAEARTQTSSAGQDGEDGLIDAQTRRLRTLGLIIGHSAAVAAYGKAKWWQDGFTGNFRSQNEGWFGRSTYSGGADKLGHFYMTYAGTRLFSRAFEWAGQEQAQARELAAWLMFGTFTAIEVLDGYSRQWSFSREDVVMNVAGIGLGLLLEAKPDLDKLLDVRVHYLPSSGSNFDPFGDYSGQIYLLVAKAAGIPQWSNHPLLRYLEFGIGYGTRGFSKDGDVPPGQRERNIYVGISLNLSALLDDKVFTRPGPHGRTQRAVDTFLEFVQVPGTGVAVKHSLDSD